MEFAEFTRILTEPLNLDERSRGMKPRRRQCDGVERRDVLRIGTAGVFGMGFSLPYLLERQARAADSKGDEKAKNAIKNDMSLIIVFLSIRSVVDICWAHGRLKIINPQVQQMMTAIANQVMHDKGTWQ